MVEIKRYIIAAAAVLLGIWGASAQQRTVIAGLEEHAEYRTLIAEEGALVRTADSLATRIASLRGRLRTDTLERAAISADIVRMEEQGFEIRSGMARLASRINTIEQEWILANLSAPRPVPTPEEADDGPAPIESILTVEQMGELRDAREAESVVPLLVARYRAEHALLAAIAHAYDAAPSQLAADSLRTMFEGRRADAERIAALIGEEWGAIFDSKSYIYNLLADKQNRRDLLARFESGMERLREQQPMREELAAPASLVDYVLQKRMITEYETTLAEDLGNHAAADSLRAVLSALPGPASLAGLGPVVLRERLFLDYADVVTGGAGPYNASNPIPEVAVWPRGVMWRVQVGNFVARQSPSIFRGARPLAFTRSDDGRFRYFAGGFPTDSLASAAVATLRRAGFRSPAAVVWMDGVFIDPSADNSAKLYRIEISGVGELPSSVRRTIADHGSTVDIVRGPGVFIVAPLDGATALRLRPALEALGALLHPGMETKLSKITE